MPDKYKSFAALAKSEVEGRDYRIALRTGREPILVLAIHGGGIESGTSEIADAIAGSDLSFYTFRGIRRTRNGELHITSHRFNEPRCVALVAEAQKVISIHGEKSKRAVVFLGGRDEELRNVLTESLTSRGFRVEVHKKRSLQGLDLRNICNRPAMGCGVQLELSLGLRHSFFKSKSSNGRRTRTKRFGVFVTAVREALYL